MIRSPLFYSGDKYKVLDQILPYIPKHKRFVDPFVGGASIIANIENKLILVNDISAELISILKYLKNTPAQEIIESIKNVAKNYNLSISAFTKYDKKGDKKYYAELNRSGHKKLRGEYNKTKSVVLLFPLVLYSYNRILRFNSKGEYNVPVGTLDINKNVIKHINDFSNSIKNKEIEFSNKNYKEIFNDVTKDDVVFIDPPYIVSTAEYNQIWTQKDEEELYVLIEEAILKGATMLVTNYKNRGDKQNYTFQKFYKGKQKVKLKSFHYSFHNNKGNDSTEYIVIVKGSEYGKEI